jgi:GNAT superfamily N-acetyltransferase
LSADRPAPGAPVPGSVTVREARPDELAAIGELTVAAYSRLPLAGDDPDHAAYLEELRDVPSRARHCTIYAAVDPDGRVLGGVTYIPGPGTPYSESERDGEAGFRMLAVDPSAQGRGVGRALVDACIERASTDNRSALVLLTLPSMRAAHRLYERLGFARAPDRDWEFAPGAVLLGYILPLHARRG